MAQGLMILFGFIGFGLAAEGQGSFAIVCSAAAICAAIYHGASVIADGFRANIIAQAQISKEMLEHRDSPGDSG